MKNILAFTLLSMLFVSGMCAKTKVLVAVLRNNGLSQGTTCEIEKDTPKVIYQDTHTYIEAELIEINKDELIFSSMISSLDGNGMLLLRGIPKIRVSLINGLGMSSLNCDGKDEHFTLIVSACA